jgi:endonuclease/exonuclease/phosphatase family metal-dependent hydrolase
MLAVPTVLLSGVGVARWDPLYEDPGVPEEVTVGPRTDGGMRILTINVAHGRGTAFHQTLTRRAHVKRNLDAIARLVRAADADVVALQELDAPSSWSGGFDHLAYLAEQAGYEHTYHGLHVARSFPRLSYGTGILSRHPLRGSESRAFGVNALDTKGFVYTVAQVRGIRLGVVSLHLDFKRDAERRVQLERLSAFLEEVEAPDHLVVAGDFNTGLGDRNGTLRGFIERHGLHAPEEVLPTFPSRRPSRPLDHVFVSGGLRLTGREPVDVRVSDHLPLLVEVVPGASRGD